ncbi:MAG: LON peptidase substrate-binding domain-containing protein, partial [Gammaproteobacteria bacterium]|nr:LON peptidase substrate-binding domain-containing protein [Gammaproteobacteria bacterium]
MDVLEKINIPLFPLDAVLFPGGVLPLRIFEPRYLDMISDCMKSESRIGVVLIEEGK